MQIRIYNTPLEKSRAFQKRNKIKKVCKCGCGQSFIQSRYNAGYIKGHSQKITRKLQIGEKAPGWKGGIRNKKGYVYVYFPNHPYADYKYVKRSRLMMEKKIGRYLKSSEIIHHINGIRDDDRIENLILTNRIEHTRNHRKGKKYDRVNHTFN